MTADYTKSYANDVCFHSCLFSHSGLQAFTNFPIDYFEDSIPLGLDFTVNQKTQTLQHLMDGELTQQQYITDTNFFNYLFSAQKNCVTPSFLIDILQ